MMNPSEIEQRLKEEFQDAIIQVEGDGRHFEALIVSDCFVDLALIQRQRQVYQVLNPWIANGQLHAISLKTLTTQEYSKIQSPI